MPTTVLTVSQNTFVSSAKPNDNFTYHPLLYIGTDEIFDKCISLLKFDFTTIATNSVDSAFLQLAVVSKFDSDPCTIVVNRITESFDASHVTYAKLPVIEATSAQIDITSEDLYKSIKIDVTQLINDWLGGVYINNGLALTTIDSNKLIQFGSDKIRWKPYFPKLILNYTVIPLLKLSSTEEHLHSLVTVNEAQTEGEMRMAITDPDLGLNLSNFDTISGAQQIQVLSELITKRPITGYTNTSDIQTALDHAVEYSVDFKNIYVLSGTSEGVGNQLHPLGTLETALAAVEHGGIIHLKGDFHISDTINISKAGITILGVGNPQIILESDQIPVIISAPSVKLNGISITSNTRHPSELIKVMSQDAVIVNCNLSGPGKPASPQPLAGITIVEGVADNYIIENNRIKSLDTGIQLLELSRGSVRKNNISDTTYGIFIDGGTAEIVENSWLGFPNDAEIIITERTQAGAPYENLVELSIANNDAVILDVRY